MQRFATSLGTGAAVLVAVAFLAAITSVAAATAASPSPAPGSGPEQLWEQFPLDAEGDSAGVGGGARARGASEQPLPRVEQVVPQAARAEAEPGPRRALEFVATAIVLLLGGVGAVLVRYAYAARRRRVRLAPKRVGSSLRAVAVAALDEIRNVRVLSRLASPAILVMASTGPTKAQQSSASDLEERPMVAPHARPASAPPETPTPGQKTMAKANDGAGLVSETDVLKAKSSGADSLKLSKVLPHVEAEALRQKTAVDATDVVKTKGAKEAAVDKERLLPKSTLALKEKLTAIAQREQTAIPQREQTAEPPIPISTRPRPSASLLHPIAELGADAQASAAPSQQLEAAFGDHVGVARTQARRLPERLRDQGISIGYLALGFIAAVTAGVFAISIASLLS